MGHNLYSFNYYIGLYPDVWKARQLRFIDTFPALAYSFGLRETDFEGWMLNCDYAKDDWDLGKQISFIEKLKTRIPKNVFEIGCGRGELACTLQSMGVAVVPSDISESIPTWIRYTGRHFFGTDFEPPIPMVGHIKDITVDWKLYDTILMVESIEHIKEEEFEPVWNNIVENFKGLFIVTNQIEYHPIPIGDWGDDAELHHCRIIDDAVYDAMASRAKRTVFRKGSHLVLEF